MENNNAHIAPISNETLVSLFRRASHFMARAYHHHGHAHHAQHHVLGILKDRGPTGQGELLEMLGVRSASLSELLTKLERNGFVLRERDPQDKRTVVVTMTEEGQAAAADAERARQDGAEMILAPLSTAERQTLGELLIKLIVSLEDRFPDHRPGHRHSHGEGHHCHGRGKQGLHERACRTGEDAPGHCRAERRHEGQGRHGHAEHHGPEERGHGGRHERRGKCHAHNGAVGAEDERDT